MAKEKSYCVHSIDKMFDDDIKDFGCIYSITRKFIAAIFTNKTSSGASSQCTTDNHLKTLHNLI